MTFDSKEKQNNWTEFVKKYYFYYDPRPGGELVAGEDEIDGLKRSMTEVSYLPLVMSLQHCFVFALFEFAISTSPITHLVYLPNFCRSIVFTFSWDNCNIKSSN